jgi:hypothetical protein
MCLLWAIFKPVFISFDFLGNLFFLSCRQRQTTIVTLWICWWQFRNVLSFFLFREVKREKKLFLNGLWRSAVFMTTAFMRNRQGGIREKWKKNRKMKKKTAEFLPQVNQMFFFKENSQNYSASSLAIECTLI